MAAGAVFLVDICNLWQSERLGKVLGSRCDENAHSEFEVIDQWIVLLSTRHPDTFTSSFGTSLRISAIVSSTLCSASKILAEHSRFDRPNKQKSTMAKSGEYQGMEHKRTDGWPCVFGLPNSKGFGIDGVKMQFVTDYVRSPLNVQAGRADHQVVNKGNGCERRVPRR
jgi:hypothetical protein